MSCIVAIILFRCQNEIRNIFSSANTFVNQETAHKFHAAENLQIYDIGKSLE